MLSISVEMLEEYFSVRASFSCVRGSTVYQVMLGSRRSKINERSASGLKTRSSMGGNGRTV